MLLKESSVLTALVHDKGRDVQTSFSILTVLVHDKGRDVETSVGTGKYDDTGPEESMFRAPQDLRFLVCGESLNFRKFALWVESNLIFI